MELNGHSCLSLEEVRSSKQQIISSKSFGQPVTQYEYLEQAVASYTARAAEKLRNQQSACQYISVHIRTHPFSQTEPYYANQHTFGLIYPTDNTLLLVKMAKRGLKRLFLPGLSYQKAAITLSDIQPKGALQLDIFSPNPQYSANPKSDALMQVLDGINQKMGKGTLQLGAEGLQSKENWQMKRNMCSPRYTTRIAELLTVSY